MDAHEGDQSSATLDELVLLWQRARRAQVGPRATQSRLARESEVSVSTINDWLTRKTVPRHGDQVLAVVNVLHRWCGEPPPVERHWHELLEQDSDSRSAADTRRAWGDAMLPRGAADHPLPGLGPNISRAFEAEQVELKAFCLSAETMTSHIWLAVERAKAGVARPRSISLRVLLPADTASLAYPTDPLSPEDSRPLRRLAAIRHRHTASIRIALEALRDENAVDVRLEFRAVPLTPTTKIYLLNGDTLLFGYYEVVQRPIEFDNADRAEIYDVLGFSTELRMFTRSDPADARFVDMTHAWFDSVWSSVAEPLPEE